MLDQAGIQEEESSTFVIRIAEVSAPICAVAQRYPTGEGLYPKGNEKHCKSALRLEKHILVFTHTRVFVTSKFSQNFDVRKNHSCFPRNRSHCNIFLCFLLVLYLSLPTFHFRSRKNEYSAQRGRRPLVNRYHCRNQRIYRKIP